MHNFTLGGVALSRKTGYLSALLLGIAFAAGVSAQTNINTVSAADYGPIVAPDSIASSFGSNLASTTATATTMVLPTTLANTQVSITDSAKNTASASLLYVSPSQINFMVPASLALGAATITVTSPTGTVQGKLLISNVSPAFFTANSNGAGVPAAQIVRVDQGKQTFENAFQGTAGAYTPAPISLQPGTVYLAMWGTGFRRHSANPVFLTVHGVSIPVTYAGVQSQFAGLDQINAGPLPASLAGVGTTDVVITIDGIPANTLQIAIQ